MPYRTLNPSEVARYLHLSRADLDRLVKNQDIPFEKRGERLVFRKADVDAWASQRILGLESRPLAEYHEKSSEATREILERELMLPELLEPRHIDSALPAKTKASVLREMVALAEKTGRVCDPQALLAGLEAREELCPTGLPGGIAVLHTRQPEAYLFESSFIALGRTVQPIPFGAPDGNPTDLFFLLAVSDDRLHLHLLARLCLMAQKTALLEELRHAADADQMHHCLLAAEVAVCRSVPSGAG